MNGLSCRHEEAQPVGTAQRDGLALFCFRESLIAWLTSDDRQNMKSALSLFVMLLITVSGFAAGKVDLAAFVRKAEVVTLFSIYPQQVYVTDEHGNATKEDRKKERFHGYPVFGKLADVRGATRASIQDALLAALSSVEDGPPLLCFEPRHAVSLKQGDTHVDLLICFECLQARVRYVGKKEMSEREEIVPIGIAGRDILNQMFDCWKIERDIPKNEPNQSPEPNGGAPSHRGSSLTVGQSR
jgi:hypothetical protein